MVPTGPYYHVLKSLPLAPILSKMNSVCALTHASFRSILTCTCMPRSSRCSFPFRFPHQNPVCISPLPHKRHIPCLSCPPSFQHPNKIQWEKHQSSSLWIFPQSHVPFSLCGQSTCFHRLGPKYYHQYPIWHDKLQSNPNTVPLFDHCNLWWYAEGAGKLKYGTQENFCSHMSMDTMQGWCSTGGWLYIVMFPDDFKYTRNPSIMIPATCIFCHFKSYQTFRSWHIWDCAKLPRFEFLVYTKNDSKPCMYRMTQSVIKVLLTNSKVRGLRTTVKFV